MLFNSQVFLLLFFPVVVASFWLLARYRHSGHPGFRLLLLLASWMFYAYWDKGTTASKIYSTTLKIDALN